MATTTYTGNDQWVWELEKKIIKNCEDIVNFGFYSNTLKEENNGNELIENQKEETTPSTTDVTDEFGTTKTMMPIGWVVALRKEGITSCYAL